MWIYVLLLKLYSISGSESIVGGPRNTAVVVGQRMEMNFQVGTNGAVRAWQIQRTSTSKMETLFTNWNNQRNILNSRFGVEFNNNSGSGMLYVNSTTLDDAGIYTCTLQQQGATQPRRYSALLIVFESEPMCSSNLSLSPDETIEEETHAWMRCTVNFRGHLVPDIEWRQHNGYGEEFEEGRQITHLTDTVIIPNSSVTSEWTLVLISNTSRLSYSFKLYFRPLNESGSMNATNAPNYTYIWKIHVDDIPSTSHDSTTYTHHTVPLVTTLSVGISLATTISVAAIIVGCLCRKRRKRASTMRPDNIPDLVTGQRGTQSDPVYAEVQRTGRRPADDSKQDKSRAGPNVPTSHELQNSRQLKYVGNDGTEYMEVNAVGRHPMPARPPTEANKFSVVGEYACVDHTQRPPNPPRS